MVMTNVQPIGLIIVAHYRLASFPILLIAQATPTAATMKAAVRNPAMPDGCRARGGR